MKEKAAETLNSLGSLKQKQGELDEAKEYYVRSLEVRQTLGDASDGMAKEKAKALAQSLTSLGNLYVMLGDAAAGDDRAAAKQKIGHYRTALEQLGRAKEEYVKGFGREDHPKVAWALEGIAKVQTKLGNQEAAEGAVAKAVGIRRASVTTNAGTQGFMKELSAAEAQHATAVAKLKASPRSGSIDEGPGSGGVKKALAAALEKHGRPLGSPAKSPNRASAGADGFATPEGRSRITNCLLYTSPSPRDQRGSRMPSSA